MIPRPSKLHDLAKRLAQTTTAVSRQAAIRLAHYQKIGAATRRPDPLIILVSGNKPVPGADRSWQAEHWDRA